MRTTGTATRYTTLVTKRGDVQYGGNYPYGTKGSATEAQHIVQPADVVLEIDVDALLNYLGPRAIGNKSGSSSMQDGLVTCTVLKRHTPAGQDAPHRVVFGEKATITNERTVAQPLPIDRVRFPIKAVA